MRYKVIFAAGLAIGYVLGTRAGRERYEEMKRLAQRVSDSPTIQEAAGLVGAQAARVADKAKGLMGDKFGGKVPFMRKPEHEPWSAESAEKVPSGPGWPDPGTT
ncbi:YtxH domain-containing protein [Microtetraspora sp. NBRC 16547]|uniref:YtxH domain-containing protein n=1 Tax=Microtetraspora sp. NBRC 16547 TaxID=3030993 RepID=UPI0025561CF5|nr:YtxH domain-containing protein [Microtetraspora sp. NBRC 16547]